MRKRFILMLCLQSALLLFLFSNLKAQVFNGDLELNTQAEVDAFNYTSVTGRLLIRGHIATPIVNLDGLSELTSIGGNFLIITTSIANVDPLAGLTSISGFLSFHDNDALTNVNGFSNLDFVRGIFISFNDILTSLDGFLGLAIINGDVDIDRNNSLPNLYGFSNLTKLDGSLTIQENAGLTNIDGLLQVTSLGGDRDVTIEKNPMLINIDGLSNISKIRDLRILGNAALININGLSKMTDVHLVIIEGNPSLTNIGGLINLENISGSFEIVRNTALADLNGLSNLKSIPGWFMIMLNASIVNLDGLSKLTSIGAHLIISQNFSLVDFCGLYALFNTGTIGGPVFINLNGANTVDIAPPSSISVNADQGVCSAILLDATIGTPTPVGCLKPFTTVHSDFPLGNIFPVGPTEITWTVTDGAGNTATTTQTITVIDNQPPTITCPGNITVKCASDVPDVDINSVTATDNCLAVISHVSDVISDQTCANRFTLTRTYKVTDVGNNTAACSQVITVYDDIPPQITGFTVSKQSLWPPNHTMRDITLNYTASDNCVSDPIITVTVISNESVNGTGDGDTDPDWEIIDNHHVKLRAERAANGDGRIYTITVTVDDGCNPPVTQSKQVMVAHNITGPQSGKPFKVGSIVNFSGVFQDKPGNTHTAKWLLDGNVAANGTVIEPSGNVNGKVSGSYKFNSPGVYKLQMNITDQTGITSYANTNNDIDAIVVVYDPNGGNTYGGGYFNSPAGALKADPTATGKASYGFAMNYFKNSTNPKGETQFEFKVGEFEFNALNFDYLVISNSMAQFKGTGKIIGGQSGIGFTMSVTDGQLDGSGVDKIRMKIYNKNNGAVIYDNQFGASDVELPTQAVGANSSVVISGTNSSLTSANTNQKTEMETKAPEVSDDLDIIAFPNPSTNNFTINVIANTNERITMQVVDMYGRIIETRNVTVNSLIRFGDRYTSGTYFVRVIQSKQHKEIKLIKLSD